MKKLMRLTKSKKDNMVAYLCLSPAIVGLLFLTIIPIFGVLGLSFTNWSGLTSPDFVGLQNYKKIFTEDFFFTKSLIVTLYYAFGAVVSSIIYAFFVSIILNQRIPARGVARSIFFIPYIIPVVATSVVWSWLYDCNFGVLNFVLNTLGFDKSLFLQGEKTVVPSLIFIAVWTCGNLIVIFLAGIQNVPRAYLEAVEIDGGNAWHKFRHVTIPMMTPIIFFNFLMCMITNLQVFVPAQALTRGGPNDSSLFIVYLIYREGFMKNNFGYASSISLIFFIFIAILTGLIFKASNKVVFYEGK